MYEVLEHSQRIVAVRVTSIPTVDVARALGRDVLAAVGQARGPVIATADLRRAGLFTPEVAEAILAILRADNPRLERSAHIVGSSATFALQIERVVREAANPRRRVFRSAPDALAYLAEVLTPSQTAWLRAFYAATEHPPA